MPIKLGCKTAVIFFLGGAKDWEIVSEGSGCARTRYTASRSIIEDAQGSVTATVLDVSSMRLYVGFNP